MTTKARPRASKRTNPPPPALSQDERARLVAAAGEARGRAYAPYSGYAVGAALLTADGTLHTGCNVENASYGATICAERVAAVKAASEGARHIRAIAVVTENGGPPCGVCRQVLYEFGPSMTVIVADPHGQVLGQYTLDELLPHGFGPLMLEK